MATQTTTSHEKKITLQLLEALFLPENMEGIRVRLWDESLWPGNREVSATLVLNYPGSLRAMLLPGTELGMAEAYLNNDVDIEGSVETIIDMADHLIQETWPLPKKIKLLSLLKQLPAVPPRLAIQRGPVKLKGKQHSIERDLQAVTYHYNVSNDFYALWLDPNMVYSCGYFLNGDDSIQKAQVEKLNYISKKLRLQAGQRLLDIGCGWGGLVVCAAQNYGVDATGITLSKPQADYANRRIAELGLSDRCRVLVQDYRDISESEPYDRLVSVDMFEHVGKGMLKEYFEKAFRLLKPYGVFLNHGISTTQTNFQSDADSFSHSYVFPDGELVPIHETLMIAEQVGFETRDVESLREHYVLTLRQWVERLERNHGRAMRFVDEHTYRVWLLFMSGSIHGFKTRRLNVYQSLFVKPGDRGEIRLPLTRINWYKN